MHHMSIHLKFQLKVICKLLFVAIGHFTVVCLDTGPLSGSEAQGDLVLIQTLLFLICKSFSCYANKFLVSIISRSPQTSLSYRDLVTCHRTVKWRVVTLTLLSSIAIIIICF